MNIIEEEFARRGCIREILSRDASEHEEAYDTDYLMNILKYYFDPEEMRKVYNSVRAMSLIGDL